jgi:hypothetical protein
MAFQLAGHDLQRSDGMGSGVGQPMQQGIALLDQGREQRDRLVRNNAHAGIRLDGFGSPARWRNCRYCIRSGNRGAS